MTLGYGFILLMGGGLLSRRRCFRSQAGGYFAGMGSATGSIRVHVMAALVLVVAALVFGGGGAHAAGPYSQVPGHFVAEDAPAADDDGDDSSSEESEPDPEPAPEPELEPEPESAPEQQAEQEPAPIGVPTANPAEPRTSNERDGRGNSENDTSEGGAKDSDIGDGDSSAGVGPATVSGPLRTPTDTSSSSLVTEDGPSPLGWLLLAAGLACGVAAFVVYRGSNSLNELGPPEGVLKTPSEGVPETTDYGDPMGPNTVEMGPIQT